MGQEDMGVVESLPEGEESDQEVVEDLEVVVGDLEEVWVEVMVKVELEEEGQGIQEELAVPMEQVLEAVVI